jgi:hypothetical protein
MGTHRLSVHVPAPPDRVFGLWIDLDRMKDWVGGVTRVTDVTGPVAQAGTTYTVWFGPMASRTEVLEADLISGLMGRIFAIGSYHGTFQGELNTFARLVEAEEANPKGHVRPPAAPG